MKAKCPLIKKPCIEHGCEFWDKVPGTGEYKCRYELTNLYLDDVAQYLQLVLRSNEATRVAGNELIKSQLQREPTPDLLKIVGVKEKD